MWFYIYINVLYYRLFYKYFYRCWRIIMKLPVIPFIFDWNHTKNVKETYWELKQQVDWQLKKYDTIKKENVKALNDKVHQLSIPIIGN